MKSVIKVKSEQEYANLEKALVKDANAFKGVVVLCDKEEMYKKRFIHALESALFPNDNGKDLNYDTFYGTDIDAHEESVEDLCATSPFAHPIRMVVVHGYDESKSKESIAEYATHPVSSACLVLTTKTELTKDAVHKAVQKGAPHVRFIEFPPANENDLRGWLMDFFKRANKSISKDAVNYLIDNIRLGFEALKAEAEKIVFFHAEKDFIDVKEITDFTHTTKIDVGFEFATALMRKDAVRAYTLLSRTDRSLMELNSLLIYKFTNLYNLALARGNANAVKNAFSKTSVWALNQDKPYLKSFTLKDIGYILSLLQRMNVRLVSQPNYAQRAYFATMIFAITRKSRSY